MILLTRMVELSEAQACSEVEILPGSQFLENNQVPSWIGIEYVAQTIAAYSGYLGRQSGKPPSIGFLLGARRYRSKVASFKLGQKLIVKVEPVLIDGDMGSFKGTIEIEGQLVADVSMTTFKPDDETLAKIRHKSEGVQNV